MSEKRVLRYKVRVTEKKLKRSSDAARRIEVTLNNLEDLEYQLRSEGYEGLSSDFGMQVDELMSVAEEQLGLDVGIEPARGETHATIAALVKKSIKDG